MQNPKQLHRIIEGALFAANEPLSLKRIAALFTEDEQPDEKNIRQALQELIADYSGRGIELKELASGYQFQIKADLSKWIKRLWEERPPRYSRALLETLVLIAYRQPITRGEIEEVRGVSVSSSIMKTLMEREWVRIVGHRDVPGKPGLYATTKAFLDYFGLKSLSDLPPLAEVRNLDEIGEKLQQQLDAAVKNVVDENDLIAKNSWTDKNEVQVDVATENITPPENKTEEDFAQPIKETVIEETKNV
jgi:segregation and condensation protein B